jgi:hypothetical protein
MLQCLRREQKGPTSTRMMGLNFTDLSGQEPGVV